MDNCLKVSYMGRMVPEKSTGSWGMTATWERSASNPTILKNKFSSFMGNISINRQGLGAGGCSTARG